MTSRHLVQTTAETERALAEGSPTPRSSWYGAATGLTDAIVTLRTAPVTPEQEPERKPDPKPGDISVTTHP